MNPYLKIAASAIIASYVSPKIINRFLREELNEMDAKINTAIAVGIGAGSTAAVYQLVSALMGGAKATTAGSGGAA